MAQALALTLRTDWRRAASTAVFAATVLVTCAIHAAQAPSAATEAVKTAVTELLDQYTLALESLDADAVKKVQPSVDAESLRSAFRQMRSLEVEIDQVAVLSVADVTVRVSCRVMQTLEPRAGSKQATTVTRVLRLKRAEDTWLIEAFER